MTCTFRWLGCWSGCQWSTAQVCAVTTKLWFTALSARWRLRLTRCPTGNKSVCRSFWESSCGTSVMKLMRSAFSLYPPPPPPLPLPSLSSTHTCLRPHARIHTCVHEKPLPQPLPRVLAHVSERSCAHACTRAHTHESTSKKKKKKKWYTQAQRKRLHIHARAHNRLSPPPPPKHAHTQSQRNSHPHPPPPSPPSPQGERMRTACRVRGPWVQKPRFRITISPFSVTETTDHACWLNVGRNLMSALARNAAGYLKHTPLLKKIRNTSGWRSISQFVSVLFTVLAACLLCKSGVRKRCWSLHRKQRQNET